MLGYSPNHAARSLRRRRTGIVTFVTGDLGNRYLAELIAAAEPVAQARGYVVNVVAARTDAAEAQVLDHLASGLCDGVVVHRGSPDTARQIAQFRARGIACVLLQGWDSSAAPCISVDIEGGALLAIRHLLALGHRRIAHVTDRRSLQQPVDERLRGFHRGMEGAGITADPGHVVAQENSYAGGDAAVRRLMQTERPPTAIFMFNDHMAIGALHALDALGLRVPQDVAVVGFDGTDLGAFSKPGLTTIHHPRVEQGRLAVMSLLDQIDGAASQRERTVLPVDLIVRASCGGVPTPPK